MHNFKVSRRIAFVFISVFLNEKVSKCFIVAGWVHTVGICWSGKWWEEAEVFTFDGCKQGLFDSFYITLQFIVDLSFISPT